MNIFKGLITKELVFLKSYKKNLILFVILAAMLCFLNDSITSFMPVYIPLILGMIATNSFVYDGQANLDRYLLSFPLNKKDIIRTKYIYILSFTVLGSILGIVFAMALQSIKDISLLNIDDIVSTGAGALFGMMILQMFQIPILIKFGYEKGKFIQMIAIVLIMMIASILSVTVMKITSLSLNEVLDMLKKYGLYIIPIITVLFYLLSYKISYNIYKKKEL